MRSTRFAFLAVVVLAPAGAALAVDVESASIVIKDHVFIPKELHVPAGKRIVLKVDNQDSTPEEFESHELKLEKVIPGSSTGTVRFGPLEPGRYPFFGEFNEATAQGVIVAE
jgi:heme/copper-type cytochrome/quinol oxidase subunit 2